jgi:arylsulfatase A-like enzyme
VPIVFWRPGVVGSAVDTPIETIDIMPTLASMLGIALAPGLVDGHCLDALPAAGCHR